MAETSIYEQLKNGATPKELIAQYMLDVNKAQKELKKAETAQQEAIREHFIDELIVYMSSYLGADFSEIVNRDFIRHELKKLEDSNENVSIHKFIPF